MNIGNVMKNLLVAAILISVLGLGGCETAKDVARTPFMALDLLKSEHSKIDQDQNDVAKSDNVQSSSVQKTVSVGDPRVKKAQILLNYSNVSVKLTEDGIMGGKTRAAIKEWQKVNGFAIDGEVDTFLMQVKG